MVNPRWTSAVKSWRAHKKGGLFKGPGGIGIWSTYKSAAARNARKAKHMIPYMKSYYKKRYATWQKRAKRPTPFSMAAKYKHWR